MAIKTRVFIIFAAVLAFAFMPCSSFAQSAKGLRTVVIDPGHGGEDTGALGLKKASTGYHEKDIVLSISLLLGEKIKKAYPDVNVMYTRSTDVFISRNDRAKLANQHADLFISIHCNGSNDLNASGTSVHILGSKSKNAENIFGNSAVSREVTIPHLIPSLSKFDTTVFALFGIYSFERINPPSPIFAAA